MCPELAKSDDRVVQIVNKFDQLINDCVKKNKDPNTIEFEAKLGLIKFEQNAALPGPLKAWFE